MNQLLGSVLLVAVVVGLLVGCHRTIDIGDQRLPSKEKGGEPGPIISRHPVLIHFKEDKHDFDAFFGANFDKGEYVQARVLNSFSQLVVSQGWVYLVGSYPFASTDRVFTFASGTTYAVQTLGDVQRVFVLDGARGANVTVQLLSGLTAATGSPTSLVVPRYQYGTITRDAAGAYTISGPFPIKGDTSVAGYLNELQTAVTAANLASWPPIQ